MPIYDKLVAWRRAHALVLRVYAFTRRFPPDERFGLTSQMRRASVSIAANLAEGAGRNTDAELARFGRIALGSANEVHYLARVAADLGYLSLSESARLNASVEEVRRLVAALVKRVERDVVGRSAPHAARGRSTARHGTSRVASC